MQVFIIAAHAWKSELIACAPLELEGSNPSPGAILVFFKSPKNSLLVTSEYLE